jgi:RNA methyltransferase, TrmH family
VDRRDMSEPFGPELTSVRSPKVKAARQLAKRALRLRARSFLAEGPQAVGEALAHGGVVSELFITAAARTRHAELADEATRQGVPVQAVSGEVMAGLAQTITPQGVLAVCRYVDIPLRRLAAAAPRLVVILASVRDPGNAGTVLRTADAAGADGVIFTDASVDPYNSKCVRATAGSLFHLPLAVDAPAAEAVSEMRGAGLRILAADGRAGRSLDDAGPGGPGDPGGPLGRPTAWLFGNEAWGLPADVLALADDVVAVPIYGKAESLNLAAAAAVCLYASARAARASQPSPAAGTPSARVSQVSRAPSTGVPRE